MSPRRGRSCRGDLGQRLRAACLVSWGESGSLAPRGRLVRAVRFVTWFRVAQRPGRAQPCPAPSLLPSSPGSACGTLPVPGVTAAHGPGRGRLHAAQRPLGRPLSCCPRSVLLRPDDALLCEQTTLTVHRGHVGGLHFGIITDAVNDRLCASFCMVVYFHSFWVYAWR